MPRTKRASAPAEAPPPRARSRTSEGFSLVELTVAIVILAVLAFTTALVTVPVSRDHRITRETDVATAAVRNILESVQAAPYTDIVEMYPPGEQITIAGLEEASVTISYEDPEADPLVMRFDLQWESAENGPMARTFYTIRTE